MNITTLIIIFIVIIILIIITGNTYLALIITMLSGIFIIYYVENKKIFTSLGISGNPINNACNSLNCVDIGNINNLETTNLNLPKIDNPEYEKINNENSNNNYQNIDTCTNLTGEGEWSGGDQFQKYYFGPYPPNQKYTVCYPEKTCRRAGVNGDDNCNIYSTMNINEKVVQMSKRRNNEKRVVDGLISKNANYYKRHFADELDLSEKLRWWGNDEY